MSNVIGRIKKYPLDKIRLKLKIKYVILLIHFAGLVYRYYAGFPSLRGGFDSRTPLHKKCTSYEVHFLLPLFFQEHIQYSHVIGFCVQTELFFNTFCLFLISGKSGHLKNDALTVGKT